MDAPKYQTRTDLASRSQTQSDLASQKLFDAEMRLAILRTKLAETQRECDGRRRRKLPTRMMETIIEIMQGDIDRMTRHLEELNASCAAQSATRT